MSKKCEQVLNVQVCKSVCKCKKCVNVKKICKCAKVCKCGKMCKCAKVLNVQKCASVQKCVNLQKFASVQKCANSLCTAGTVEQLGSGTVDSCRCDLEKKKIFCAQLRLKNSNEKEVPYP